MGKLGDLTQPLKQATFFCRDCAKRFKAEPNRIEDEPQYQAHPWAYFCDCPDCGKESRQIDWERACCKANGKDRNSPVFKTDGKKTTLGYSDMSMRNQRAEVQFLCEGCKRRFLSEPDRVEDDPTNDPHPWAYFCGCPECGEEAQQVHWERNLMRTVGTRRGPNTPEGLAKISELSTPKTQEHLNRLRFQGLKHGRYLRVKSFVPARPGKYEFCGGCDVPHDICGKSEYCLTQTAHMARFVEAYENKDPSMLMDLYAQKQAHFQTILDMAIMTVIKEGVSYRAPVWDTDKEGNVRLAKVLDELGNEVPLGEIRAHPLLRFISDAFQKNNLALADMAMTPRVQEEDGSDIGHLKKEDHHGMTRAEYQERQAAALENLRGLIDNSRKKSQNDPVLIEYKDG